jgi:cytochrome c553
MRGSSCRPTRTRRPDGVTPLKVDSKDPKVDSRIYVFRGILWWKASLDLSRRAMSKAAGAVPNLAGMDAAVICRQPGDYRSGKRLWSVMSATAGPLTDQDSTDVAAWFAHRADEQLPVEAGHSPRRDGPTIRLVFAGDPGPGLPACAACHGVSWPRATISLEHRCREANTPVLAAFAQRVRRNDINRQMRTIAARPTPEEMHASTACYGAEGPVLAARK